MGDVEVANCQYQHFDGQPLCTGGATDSVPACFVCFVALRVKFSVFTRLDNAADLKERAKSLKGVGCAECSSDLNLYNSIVYPSR